MQGIDWSCIRCFASTGEASSAEDSHWLSAQAGYKPVLEICGGTELGGGFLAGSMLQPQAPATFSTPTIGTISASLILTVLQDLSSLSGKLKFSVFQLTWLKDILFRMEPLIANCTSLALEKV